MAMVINEADSSIYSSNASPIRIHLSYASVGNRIALARGEVIKEVILWTHFTFHEASSEKFKCWPAGRAPSRSLSRMWSIVTQLAFYCGWPKAWSTFPLIAEIYGEEGSEPDGVPSNLSVFPVGQKNDAFAQYFIGQSYLAPLSLEQVPVFNVTFEPGCRNNWHIHHASEGGGQMLICVSGRGWYQEWGKEPRELHPGNVVNIPAGVKHWHGAASDSWFQHLAIEVPGKNGKAEWLEPVDDEQYSKL